jgi:hypothetical protein
MIESPQTGAIKLFQSIGGEYLDALERLHPSKELIGITFEDRQDLLGYKAGRITTHYSMAEIANLISAAIAVCEEQSRKSHALVIPKKKFRPQLVKQLGGTSM